MKTLAIALACAAAPLTYPSFALEPWHDYYTAKAMKEEAAKKQLANTTADTGQPQAPKDKKESRKDDKQKK